MEQYSLDMYGKDLMERFNKFLSEEGLIEKLNDFFLEEGFEKPRTILEHNSGGDYDGNKIVTIKITAVVNPYNRSDYAD